MSLSTEVVDKFKKVVEGIQKTANILITQVDPDALASAFTMMNILRAIRNGSLNVKIFYAGQIGHPQNRTLVNRLSLLDRMRPVSEMKEQDFTNLILVDSSSSVDGRCLQGRKLNPIIVVDHHSGSDIVDGEDKFILIEKVGAASTLVFEIAEGIGAKFEDMDSVIPILLAVGIHTDTLNLVACTDRDISAYGKVILKADRQELMAMFNYPLQETNYRNLALALQNISQHGAHLVTNIGPIDSNAGDDISTVADLLIRKDGVSLVIVWAMIKDKKEVRISARSTDSSLDLCSFLRDRFGASCGSKPTPDKKSSGGGTMSLDLGFWLNSHTTLEVAALVKKFIDTAIFH